MINGEKLREIRKEHNLTKLQINLITGISISYISRLEKKLRNPSLSICVKLANAYNMDLIVFLKLLLNKAKE